jgi:alpha-1,3-glucosyltransferase
MRWTVLSSDLMVFFPAALWFVWTYMKDGVGGGRERRDGWMWLLAMVLINPCLVLIDHGHFQVGIIIVVYVHWSRAIVLTALFIA